MGYHHGDAKPALLAAAAALLEQDGAAGLSLRQVAERAGLSRQAPYNHFANKEAMLAELAGSGFRMLSARMSQADAARTPLERLATAAEAYIAFGTEHPAVFRLMFTRELVDICRYPAAQAEADTAMARLSVIVADIVPENMVTDAMLVAWSLVHGYTELCIEVRMEDASMHAARARLFAHAVSVLAR